MLKNKRNSTLKNFRLQVLFSEEDSELINKAAKTMFLDRSAFCRRCILQETFKILNEEVLSQ